MRNKGIPLLLLFAALTAGFSAALAQQGPQITLYRHNWALLNPAAFPRNYFEDQELLHHFSAASRAQTIFIEGFPQHHNVRFEYIPDLESYSDVKLGFFVSSDKAGALGENRIQGNFAYSFALDRKHQLSIGGTLSWTNQRVNINKVNWQTTPNVPLDINSRSYLDLNIGIFYYQRSRSGSGIRRYAGKFRTFDNQPPFYAGISTIQLVSRSLSSVGGNAFVTPFQPHYYAVVGGVVKGFEPSVWIRYLPGLEYHTWGFSNPLSVDFNVRRMIRQLWIGAGLSTNATANAEFGCNLWLSDGTNGIGNLLQLGFAMGNLGISPRAIGGGPNLELSVGFNF
ncbi:MAG: type IX secretion system membrane protein PorP/SprF [Saprospiraceae bacterium]|nr:type IX secretion system membrane protein PorP/SprF [Saprospiraceae bacterium]